jgi:glycosyltransferase involved in cell wall biosynthesis
LTRTLRVIIDQILAPVPGGIGRYAEELTRALIATAAPGSSVVGIVSAFRPRDDARIAERLPGLDEVLKTRLARRELSTAWQHGFGHAPGNGTIHATSLLAPLRARPRREQSRRTGIAVTIHDAVPWTHPETLTPRGVSWHKAMAKRAERYADAIVVDTHAVADDIGRILNVGDRLRVIPAAVSDSLRLPKDSEERAARLELPGRYLLSVGTLEPRKGIEPLIRSLVELPDDLPLLIVGPAGWGAIDADKIARDVGLAEGRVRTLGRLSDEDLAVALDRASVFVFPSLAEGFGLPLLEAFSLGTPVVHSDDPALVENAAGAGISVERADAAGYPVRLAEAIGRVLSDNDLAAGMRSAGLVRVKDFSWNDSAEKVWRLHEELSHS